jgi:hypothetical protein
MTTNTFASSDIVNPVLTIGERRNVQSKSVSSGAAPATEHALLDALRGIAYMTGSPVQRHQYRQQNDEGLRCNVDANKVLQQKSGAAARVDDDGVAALVDLLKAGVDAQRLAAVISQR